VKQGTVVWDSHTEDQAQAMSPVARGFDAILPGDSRRLTFDAPSLTGFPPEPTTLEIDGGRALVVRVPRAFGEDRVLVVDTILRRGIRQLVLVRSELARLIFFQGLVAIVAGVILARALVRPIETLSERAKLFPVKPIADRELLGRADELGDLARSFNELVTSLDAKWKDSVSLAGELTHEFKNPLATIAAASERLAEAKDLTPEKRAQWTRLIAEAVSRLQHSTEALLDEVKTAARVRQAQRETLDYRGWLEALLESYRSNPRFQGWVFELDVAPDVGTVRIDPEGWGAALRNLLDNALVQPATKKVVRLEVRREREQVHTDVIDFGPGVSAGNRDKIFTRFFTQRPEGQPRGTGLGLSIVQAIAEAHGGRIELRPAESTRGASFRLTLC
jgi:two-component system sensor histidine kinase ChvG